MIYHNRWLAHWQTCTGIVTGTRETRLNVSQPDSESSEDTSGVEDNPTTLETEGTTPNMDDGADGTAPADDEDENDFGQDDDAEDDHQDSPSKNIDDDIGNFNNYQEDDSSDSPTASFHIDDTVAVATKNQSQVTRTNRDLAVSTEQDYEEQKEEEDDHDAEQNDILNHQHLYLGEAESLPPLYCVDLSALQQTDDSTSDNEQDTTTTDKEDEAINLFDNDDDDDNKAQQGETFDPTVKKLSEVPDDKIKFPKYSANVPDWIYLMRKYRAYLHLIELCDSMGCPKEATGLFLNKWVKEHCTDATRGGPSSTAFFQPGDKHPTRDTFLEGLRKKLGLSPPEAIPVPLEWDESDPNTPPSMKETTVYRFNFEEQLLGVLNNPGYMRLDRLVVNDKAPFTRYIANEHIKEVQDAWVYQTLLDHFEHQIKNDDWFIVGLLLYVDKTHSDGKGRFCLEPLIAYLTLLDTATRGEIHAQIILGYINDLDLSSTAYKVSTNTVKNRGRSCRNYHKQLRVLLEPIYKRQPFHNQDLKPDELLRARIRINNPTDPNKSYEKVCKIIPTVVAVLGDGKSQDHIVGRYASYNIKCKRICWQCDVTPANITNPYNWKYLDTINLMKQSRNGLLQVCKETMSVEKQKKIKLDRKLAREYLDSISQYVVDNALVQQGNSLVAPSPLGVPGSCVVDVLHTILEGIMSYCLISFFARLTPTVKKKIDVVIQDMMRSNSQSEMTQGNFPRMNFTFGVSNCTRLTAGEWHGLVVCVTVLLASDRGRRLLHEPLERSQDKIDKRIQQIEEQAKRVAAETEAKRQSAAAKKTNASSTKPAATSNEETDGDDDEETEEDGTGSNDEDMSGNSRDGTSGDSESSKKRARTEQGAGSATYKRARAEQEGGSTAETGADSGGDEAPEVEDSTNAQVSEEVTDYEAVYDFNDNWTAACDDPTIKPTTQWSGLRKDSVINKYLTLFEQLLTFEAWTKRRNGFWKSSTKLERQKYKWNTDSFPVPVGQQHAEEAITTLIEFLKESKIPRLNLKGQFMKSQWSLPKVHWAQHYPKNITCFGPLVAQDCEIGEKSHKYHGKMIAATAQKRVGVFAKQCADRKFDQIIINAARLKLDPSRNNPAPPPPEAKMSDTESFVPQNATRFTLTFEDAVVLPEDDTKAIWTRVRPTPANGSPRFNLYLEENLCYFLQRFFSPSTDQPLQDRQRTVRCVSEIRCGNKKLGQLRGHWDYHGDGRRANDWVLIHRENLKHAKENLREYRDVVEMQSIGLDEERFPVGSDPHIEILSDWGQLGAPQSQGRQTRRERNIEYNPGANATSRNLFVPCQILFFCYLPYQDEGTSPHVLLRPCETERSEEDKKFDTVLFTRWKKQYRANGKPRFVIMPLSTLYERVFVAEDEPISIRQDKRDTWDARMYRYEHEKKTGPGIYPEVSNIQDLCYVSHPTRLWPAEFTRL